MKAILRSKKLVYFALTTVLVLSLAFIGLSCKSTATTTTSKPPTTTTSVPPTTTSKPPTTTTGAPTTTSAPATTTATATPKSGGTLKIILSAEPIFLYPPDMTGQGDGEGCNLCLETLFSLDAQGNIVPWLATDYVADPNSNTITIHLRKGVKFTDGSDFNSAVVKWNMQQYQAGSKAELSNVTTIDTPDDYTVLLHLKQFDNTIIYNLSTAADAGRMISEVSYNTNGGKTWADKHPVGTGPFKFVSWTPDVSVVYTRNDNYWGGKVYLDGVTYLRISDPTTAQMTFASGGADIFPIDSGTAQQINSSGKYNMNYTTSGAILNQIGYAGDPNSPFSALAVRQAMSYAMDIKTLSDALGFGTWIALNQWAIPGTWGFNTNVVGYPFNAAKAKQLLASAGYPNGLSTTLNYYAVMQSANDEAAAAQKMLGNAGFNVTLNAELRGPFSDAMTNGKGWNGIITAAAQYMPYDPLVRYANVARGFEAKGTYMPQELVNAYFQAIAAPDQATKQQLTLQLQSLAIDKYCIMTPICITPLANVKQKRVTNDQLGVLPCAVLNPFAWVTDGK